MPQPLNHTSVQNLTLASASIRHDCLRSSANTLAVKLTYWIHRFQTDTIKYFLLVSFTYLCTYNRPSQQTVFRALLTRKKTHSHDKTRFKWLTPGGVLTHGKTPWLLLNHQSFNLSIVQSSIHPCCVMRDKQSHSPESKYEAKILEARGHFQYNEGKRY